MPQYYEPKKYPYGIKVYPCSGTWFVDQETPSEQKTLATFDEERQAQRYAQKLVLNGKK